MPGFYIQDKLLLQWIACALAHNWLMTSLMKACALAHEVYVKCDVKNWCYVAPWRYRTVNNWLTLGEHKRGIDHPCWWRLGGDLYQHWGQWQQCCMAVFEGFMYAPIRNLIAIVGGLRPNCNQLSALVPPIIWMEWHCAFAQFHTVECQHKTNVMPYFGSIATAEMDQR